MRWLREALSVIMGYPVGQPTNNQVTTKISPRTRQKLEKQLIQTESQIGGAIFGQVPAGVKRDFFCIDERTWVWSDSWTEQDGTIGGFQIKYELQDGEKVLKFVDGQARGYIKGQELDNLLTAINTYHDRVLSQLYNQPSTLVNQTS